MKKEKSEGLGLCSKYAATSPGCGCLPRDVSRQRDISAKLHVRRAASAVAAEPMTHIAFDIDDGVLARLHRDPGEFTRELRIAAAVKWYERELVSQGRAAEIAGVSRAEFVEALGRYGITPFQDTLEELMQAAQVPANG